MSGSMRPGRPASDRGGQTSQRSNPKRVLIHLTASRYGGVETHVYHLSRVLTRAGVQVTLTSQRKFELNEEWTTDLRSLGVEIVAPPRREGWMPGWLHLLLSRRSLARRLAAGGYDLVLGQGHGGAFAWMKRFVKPGGQLVWHEYWYGVPTHGDDYAEYRVPAPARFGWKMRRMVDSLDAIVTGCERSVRNLLDVQRVDLPIRVVPPLTNLDDAHQAVDSAYDEDSVVRISMVARLGRGKGLGVLLELWRELKIGKAELHLYGQVAEHFLPEVEPYRDDPTIFFHGPFERASLPDILRDADIGLMLSLEEGYGLSVWEYMAAGLPFVMTDCGAAREFTRDNPDGLMVDATPATIKAGIEEMVRRVRSGGTSRARLQRHHARQFSFEQIAEAHVQDVLGTRRPQVEGWAPAEELEAAAVGARAAVPREDLSAS